MANKLKKVHWSSEGRSRSTGGVEGIGPAAPKLGRNGAPVPLPVVFASHPSRRAAWYISLALIFLVSLVFFRVAGFDFVSFDDQYSVYKNSHIYRGFTADGIEWAFSNYTLFYWQPLTYLSHMLDCQLFGLNAGAHHLVNVAIHALNGLLLFLLLLRLTHALWRSAAVAILFSIHPLTVESVAWVTERNTLLVALFSILAMWAYVKYLKKPGPVRYSLILVALILACMSKPIAVVIPFALLLLDWWPLERLRGLSLTRLLREKTLLFAVAGASAILTLASKSQSMAPISDVPIQVRLAGTFVAFSHYLLKFLWPHPLGVFYQYSVPAVEQTSAAILAFTLLTLGAISLRRRFPYLLWGWLWYLLALFPLSGIFQMGGQSIADRFTYLPSIGIFVALVWIGAEFVRRMQIKPAQVAAACLILTAVLGWKSWMQTETWRDSISLYSQAIKATNGNEPMHKNLAVELVARGRIDEAILHYREAARLDPGREGLHYELGRLLAARGRTDEAIDALSDELRITPNSLVTLKELGFLYLRETRLKEAGPVLRSALRIAPNDPDINSLGQLLAMIPEQAGPPPVTIPAISVSNALFGPDLSLKSSFLTPGVQWNCAMILACLLLAFLAPHFNREVFESIEKSWLRLSTHKILPFVTVCALPMAVRLLVLPIHPIPQPKIHDEFGYLLIADTFATGRLANPIPAMWPHFVTHYIFFQPTYASKYPIGEPALMAAAQVLGLAPWFGVWLAAGLMCGALYWMLGGWMPPRWALLGALIAAVRFSISSYWMNSYWGGALAAIGGALVLGALPRIRKTVRTRDCILFAVGLLLLANTRPYEGFLLSIPVAIILIVWLRPFSDRFRRMVMPISAVLIVGFVFMAYYNWRVTGNPLLMPYKLNQKLYGTPTPFYFESPLPEPPAVGRYQDLRDNFLWQRENYMTRWPPATLASVTGRKLTALWDFYFQPALTVPLLFLPFIWRKRSLRPLVLSAAFVLAGIALYPFFFPHYAAPIFAVFLLMVVQGLRHLRVLEWHGRPVGVLVFRAILLILLCNTTSELLGPWIGQNKTVRSEATRKLEAAGGRHLLLVRYKPGHSFHFGWIYNNADIDAAPLVWARELDRESNEELIRHYPDRKPWLFEVDEYPARLSPYPGSETKQAGLTRE